MLEPQLTARERARTVRLDALGSTELRVDGEARPIQARRLALLAYLLIARPRGFHRRDILVTLFWPESDDRRARNSLSQALHGLRRLLGSDAVRARGTEEVAVDLGNVACDALEFDRAIEVGCDADALALYRGELLAGLHVSGATGFERWLDTERIRFRRRAKDAARALADQTEASDDRASALRWLRRGLEIPPPDEIDVRRLITTLDRDGDRAAAMRAYDEFVSYLEREYETTPSSETRAVADAIRAGERAAAAPRDGRVEKSSGSGPGLAVLPLQNLTGDPAQEYFADGMTEMLITELARSPALRVISRQSTTTFKRSALRLADIARRLDVELLIEGSVLRAGNRVRVAAQLVRAEPEEHLWADAFDGDLGDLLVLQQTIARGIAEAIGEALAPVPRYSVAAPQSVDPGAIDAFLRGIVRLPQMNPANWLEIIACFERATSIDENFAEAWSFLALARTFPVYLGLCSRDEAAAPALAASERAIALMPRLGSVHALRATVLQSFTCDWPAVRASLARAAELGGGDVRAYAVNVTFITSIGDFEEGIRRAEEVVRYDPLGSPVHFNLGWVLCRARRYTRAIEQLEWTISQWPYYTWAFPFLAVSQLFAGRVDEAIATCRRTLASPVDNTSLAYLAATLGRAGARDDAGEAIRRLEEIDRTAWLDPYPLAVAYAGVGDESAMMAALDRIVKEGSAQAWVLPVEVFFDPYRDDPRFEQVVASLDLPHVDPPEAD